MTRPPSVGSSAAALIIQLEEARRQNAPLIAICAGSSGEKFLILRQMAGSSSA